MKKNIHIHSINNYAALLCAFFLTSSLSTGFFFIWFFTAILSINKENLKKTHFFSKKHTPQLLLIAIFLLSLVSLLYAENTVRAFQKLTGTRLPLLLFPILSFISQKEVSFYALLKAYIAGCFFIIIIHFFYIPFHFYTTNNIEYYKNFFHSITLFLDNISHRSYIGNNILIAFFAIVFLYVKKQIEKKHTPYYIIFILSGLLFIIINNSRAVSIALFSALLVSVFYFAKNKKNFFITISTLLLVLILIFSSNNRFSETIQRINNEGIENIQEPRLVIWENALEIIKNQPWKGYGIENAQTHLQEKYIANHFEAGIFGRFNAHNQYIETSMELGLLGIFCFLTLLFSITYFANTKKTFYLFFTLAFAVNFFFESMLVRTAGVLTFTFFISIMHFSEKSTTSNILNIENKLLKIFSLLAFISILSMASCYTIAITQNHKIQTSKQEDCIFKQSTAIFNAKSKPYHWDNKTHAFHKYLCGKIEKNKTLSFSVDCFVSKNFNGDKVQIVAENNEYQLLHSTTYNLNKKGEKQRLQMEISTDKDIFINITFHIYQKNVINFKTLNGEVVFSNPEFEINTLEIE